MKVLIYSSWRDGTLIASINTHHGTNNIPDIETIFNKTCCSFRCQIILTLHNGSQTLYQWLRKCYISEYSTNTAYLKHGTFVANCRLFVSISKPLWCSEYGLLLKLFNKGELPDFWIPRTWRT